MSNILWNKLGYLLKALLLHTKIQSSQCPGWEGGLVPGLPWIPKSNNAQVPYIIWYSTCIRPMHILLYTFFLGGL